MEKWGGDCLSEFHNEVVEAKRVNSCIILVKIVWRDLIFNSVSDSDYGPQVGLSEVTKREF